MTRAYDRSSRILAKLREEREAAIILLNKIDAAIDIIEGNREVKIDIDVSNMTMSQILVYLASKNGGEISVKKAIRDLDANGVNPGKNRHSNISKCLSRSEDFERIGRGEYRLII